MAPKKKKFNVTWNETHTKSIEVMARDEDEARRMIEEGDYKESEANDEDVGYPENIETEEMDDD